MPNAIYRNREDTKWFVPATATEPEDAAFEVHNLASGAGRQSAQLDLTEDAVSMLYEWRAFVQFATTPVVGETIDIFLKTAGSDAAATTHPDNDDGTSEGAVSSSDKLNNLHRLGAIVVDEAVADIEMVASDFIEIAARAVQVVFWNSSADALTNDVNENGFMLTPVPLEVQ